MLSIQRIESDQFPNLNYSAFCLTARYHAICRKIDNHIFWTYVDIRLDFSIIPRKVFDLLCKLL